MENQTRFCLSTARENWRAELAAQANLTSENRRELDAHLCDAIAGFQQQGLNDEESFLLARHRVGRPQQLSEEFIKADPNEIWRTRAFWILVTLIILGSWNTFFSALANISRASDQYGSHFFYPDNTRFILLQLVCALPFVGMLTFVTNHRVRHQIIGKASLFFYSKNRIVTGAILLVTTSRLIEIYSRLLNLRTHGSLLENVSLQFILISFSQLVIPCSYVGALIWLTPKEKQKELKSI